MSIPAAIVVYHAKCADGLGALYAFDRSDLKLTYKDNCRYIAANYQESAETIAYITAHALHSEVSADIYIVDFSFPVPMLCELANNPRVNKVVVLDHHIGFIQAWMDKSSGIEIPANLHVNLDNDKSGAVISWEYFNPYVPMIPLVLQYIQDRDLWQFNLPFSTDINAYIGVDLTSLSRLHNIQLDLSSTDGVATVAARGSLVRQVNERHLDQLEEKAYTGIIDGHEGLFCNAPGQFASDLGNRLAAHNGSLAVIYEFVNATHIKYSLRSVGDTVDCNELAKRFGGGGHKNAAGFTLYYEEHEDCMCCIESEAYLKPETVEFLGNVEAPNFGGTD